MKQIILIFLFILALTSANFLSGQKSDIRATVDQFRILYETGDIIGAEKYLKKFIENGYEMPVEYRIYIYNNLGATSTLFSRYGEALYYYNMAEKSVISQVDTLESLWSIYVNKALVYSYQKSNDVAEEYFARAIRLMLKTTNRDIKFYRNLSATYLNYGLFLYETCEYQLALDYLHKSEELKTRFNLPDLDMVYLNMAKTYLESGKYDNAQEYFEKCRYEMVTGKGKDYFRIPSLYFSYSQFLRTLGKDDEAISLLQKALSICLHNYGEKHSLTSRSYQLIGDIYFSKKDFQGALEYYQNSLISITEGFDDHDIFSNPSADSSIFDLRLLDNLKRKSAALEMAAPSQTDTPGQLKYLTAGLGTIELAAALTGRIRSKYLTRESRLWLSENEKNTYLAGVKLARRLFTITGDIGLMEKMYLLAGDAKARLLRDEITRNDFFYSSAMPDSLWQQQKQLESIISANNIQVTKESLKETPDTVMISRLKDAMFAMRRESEKVYGEIDARFPVFRQLLERTNPVPVDEIQKRMKRDETIIDYYICAPDSSGMRNLYTFLITGDRLTFHEVQLDTLFFANAALIFDLNQDPRSQVGEFSQYTGALYYMYNVLIKPLEAEFSGKKLIIIPDEEISWLPFDAFLASPPGPGQTDYENLDYLIKRYVISSGYSSSLVFDDNKKRSSRVVSFLPDYPEYSDGDFESLRGAEEEISSVYRWFRGERFEGVNATETNFRKVLDGNSLIHLAMHSVPDTLNPEYSFLQFSAGGDPSNDGKLFNYEISLSRTNSPLVVISACNSGAGRLYQSEGLMSIARSFMLAGASSVIKTSWKINDETSARIMAGFYRYLSKGKPVNEALRYARLDYLKSSSPAFTCPYYWAAYEVLGGTSPVTGNKKLLILTTGIVVAVVVIFVVFYFRRRRISPAGSL